MTRMYVRYSFAPMSAYVEKGHGPLLVAVCAGLFCMPFMMAGVSAVLPLLGEELHATARELGLIGAAYALGLAMFQLGGGSMGDIWGYRRIFLWGTALFALTGAAQGFVPSVDLLLPLRFLQGVGGAILNACGLALLASVAPEGRRAVYLGFSSASISAGVACGPAVAGILADSLGWRWLFWGNALLALAVLCLMNFFVQFERRPTPDHAFDWKGCSLYGLGMTALTCGASLLADRPLPAWCLLAAFGVLLVAFCLYEWSAKAPLLDLRLLGRSKIFALSALASLVNYASLSGLVVFFSLYLHYGLDMHVREAGFLLALQSAVQVLTTPLAARLCLKIKPGWVSGIGVFLCGQGVLAATLLRLDSSIWLFVAVQTLLGIGISFFAMPNTTIMFGSAGPDHVGQASGLNGAVRTGGQLFNLVLITLTMSFFLHGQSVRRETVDSFMSAMHLDLKIFGLLNVLALICILVRYHIFRKARSAA